MIENDTKTVKPSYRPYRNRFSSGDVLTRVLGLVWEGLIAQDITPDVEHCKAYALNCIDLAISSLYREEVTPHESIFSEELGTVRDDIADIDLASKCKAQGIYMRREDHDLSPTGTLLEVNRNGEIEFQHIIPQSELYSGVNPKILNPIYHSIGDLVPVIQTPQRTPQYSLCRVMPHDYVECPPPPTGYIDKRAHRHA